MSENVLKNQPLFCTGFDWEESVKELLELIEKREVPPFERPDVPLCPYEPVSISFEDMKRFREKMKKEEMNDDGIR